MIPEFKCRGPVCLDARVNHQEMVYTARCGGPVPLEAEFEEEDPFALKVHSADSHASTYSARTSKMATAWKPAE